MTWCVLVHDANMMAPDLISIGPYRSKAKAWEVADQINRKIKLHAPCMAEDWDMEGGEPRAWVQEMRTKVTEVYASLKIQKLEN